MGGAWEGLAMRILLLAVAVLLSGCAAPSPFAKFYRGETFAPIESAATVEAKDLDPGAVKIGYAEFRDERQPYSVAESWARHVGANVVVMECHADGQAQVIKDAHFSGSAYSHNWRTHESTNAIVGGENGIAVWVDMYEHRADFYRDPSRPGLRGAKSNE